MKNLSPVSHTCLQIAVSLSIVLSLVVLDSPVGAGAYEWGGLGSRAQSMGGAFVGVADDWTAIYWNPAGLAQLEGSGFGFDFSSPHPVITDGSSLSNLTSAQMDTRYQIDTFAQFGGEPTRFADKTVEYNFYVPAGAGGYWQQDGWTLGGGFYVPVGYYLDWDDTISYNGGVSTISAKLFQQLGIRAFNLSAGRQINPKWSFGVGFNLLYGSIDYKAQKFATNTAVGSYSSVTESHNSGTGYEGIFGLLYKATDKLNVGAVYRTGAKVELDGDATSYLTLTGLNERTDFRQKFQYPETLGVGLAYKARPDLTLAADWNRTMWSAFRIDVNYKVEGMALRDKDYSADWKDSNRYRFGFEYRPTKTWSVRAGYMFDESPLRDKSVSMSNIVGVDRHNVTVGIGRSLKDNLSLDVIYGYAWGDRKVSGVRYKQRVNFVGLSVDYRFK